MGSRIVPNWHTSWQAAQRLSAQLLAWYDANRRDLPWRRTADPYCIWVSEIMLQQTRVVAVTERYTVFLERFPTVADLARALEAEVLTLWSGLGYYRRARMLHQAAQFVVENLRGEMPVESEALRKLPGIGAYTAAAIASIAHGERIAVVDGNVERVICRLAGLDASAGKGAALRREIDVLANVLVDSKRPGDFNQAMMELGATVCLPRNPQCLACPVVSHCTTRGEHPTTPRARMQSRAVDHALCIREGKAGRKVLLEQRPATETVMTGMWELPRLTGGDTDGDAAAERICMTVRHAIMQVNYSVRIHVMTENEVAVAAGARGRYRWTAVRELSAMPLTGLARKVLTRAHLLAPRTEQRRKQGAPAAL
jgi:A/G-specific adenine glycosylase